jgi:hypothetical protein
MPRSCWLRASSARADIRNLRRSAFAAAPPPTPGSEAVDAAINSRFARCNAVLEPRARAWGATDIRVSR